MIVIKVTCGYVNQQFDTTTGSFIRQDFHASDEPVVFLDENGNELKHNERLKRLDHSFEYE